MQQLRGDVISFLQNFLAAKSGYMTREDYREMIELCLIMLGISLGKELYHVRMPGAYHLARWMAKVITAAKYTYSEISFKLTAAERRNMGKFCLFASHIYISAWIRCPVTCDAPVNDLMLYKQIAQYARINKPVCCSQEKVGKPPLVHWSRFHSNLPFLRQNFS